MSSAWYCSLDRRISDAVHTFFEPFQHCEKNCKAELLIVIHVEVKYNLIANLNHDQTLKTNFIPNK
jgi:hypothetical protein